MTAVTQHLVSLMWNAPLPVYAMAHRLAPKRMTLISPGAGPAGEAAEHIVEILLSEGFNIAYRPVASAVDPVAERDGLPALHKVLDKTIRHRPEVTLDYTGGSKLMSAYARWLLGDNPGRAVYLDARTSDAVFDDGTRVPYDEGNLPLDLIAGLHRTMLSEWRRVDVETPLERDLERGDALLKRLANLTRGMRAFTTADIVTFVNAAADGRPDELRAAIGRFARGSAVLLDLEINKQGDWLERWLAARVRQAVPDADVYLNVEGRLELPAVTRLLGALQRAADGSDVNAVELAEASSEAVGAAHGTSGARFEIDVVAVRGYRVSALSCYAGVDPAKFAWKAREISVRAAQLGGSVTRPVFVAPLESEVQEQLASDLMPGWDKLTGTRVLGLHDLLRTAYGDLGPLREALVGRPPQVVTAAGAQDAMPSAIDLVATVGGSPLPTHEAIAAHDARNVLLVHSPDMRGVALRLADANRAGGRAVTLREVDAFDGATTAAAVREAGETAALDVTGGTKPMAAHALLAHAAGSDVASARVTYVDGLQGVLRQLDGTAQRLSLKLQPSDVMLLHGWRLTGQTKPSRRSDEEMVRLAARVRADDRHIRSEVVAAIAAALSAQVPGAIARCNLTLRHAEDEAVADPVPDVVAIVNGVLCAVFVPWTADDDPKERVWQALSISRQLGGAYTRVALITRLKPDKARHCEQATVLRTGGVPQARVFSATEVADALTGNKRLLAGWATGRT
jgi:hypothetical protein